MIKNKSIILIGGGGHSKVLFDVLKKKGLRIIGFIDRDNALFRKHDDSTVLTHYIMSYNIM